MKSESRNRCIYISVFCLLALCLINTGCRNSSVLSTIYTEPIVTDIVPLTSVSVPDAMEKHSVAPDDSDKTFYFDIEPDEIEPDEPKETNSIEPEIINSKDIEESELQSESVDQLFENIPAGTNVLTVLEPEYEYSGENLEDVEQEIVYSKHIDSSEFDSMQQAGTGDADASEASVAADQSVYEEPEPEQTYVSGEPIDLLFVMGQSNAAGLTDQPSGYAQARMESIACDADQIYSSYIPLDDCGRAVSGVDDIGSYLTQYDVSRYISYRVGSEISRAGTKLAYKPYALSPLGTGKTGMDSAIAYVWNQLTGRKVWITNVSYSGSAISSWVPGTNNYEAAIETVREVIDTVNNDPDYYVGRIRMFWLQGESDTFTTQSEYENSFKSLIGGLLSVAGDIKVGIIIPRAMGGNSNPFDPTPAQAALRSVASAYGNVAVVSDLNLTWANDQAVADYFRNAYPDGIWYPTHNGVSLTVPSLYSEVYVHPHYTQVGHNENGLNAAQNMFTAFG